MGLFDRLTTPRKDKAGEPGSAPASGHGKAAADDKRAAAAIGPALAQQLDQVRQLKQSGKLAEAATLLDTLFKAGPHPVVGYRLVATLLDLRRYADIVAQPALRPFNSRDFSVAERLLERPDRLDPLCLDGHAAQAQWAYVSMVKDEQDIVLFNLVWHYMLGFRRFFLIDNQSTDATPALIQAFARQFPDAEVLVLHDTVVAHFQGRKVSGAVSYLKTLWPELDWVALIDADEFLCAEQPLHNLMAQAPAAADALVLPKSVYRPVPGEDMNEVANFQTRLTHRQALSHVSTKVMVRAAVGLDIAQGNHRFFEPHGYTTARYEALPGLTMREYPIRSLAQFERKVVNGQRAIDAAKAQGLAAVGGDHWIRMHRVLAEQGRAGLAERLRAQANDNQRSAGLRDPLPLEDVMSRLWPDWRATHQALVLTGDRQTGS